MKTSLCFALLLAAAAVTACDPSVYQDSRTQFIGYGNSTRQNSAVMVIDPQPASAGNVDIDFDGRKGSIAIERYRTGQVIPPEDMTTTN